MSIRVEIELKEIPTACSKCPFYSNREYRCHNERGTEARCSLGYMHGDMRDLNFYSDRYREEKYSGCMLEFNVINDNTNESIH